MTIDRPDLLSGVTAAILAADDRSTKPILGCVLIDGQTVQATDLERSIRYTLRADTGLRVCVKADKLAAILKASDCETIDATLKGDTLTLKTTSGTFKLPTMPVDEFPAIESIEGESFTVPGLSALVKRVAFAADKRESGARWAVTGVLMEVMGGTLRLVATDTKRLVITEVPCDFADTAALLPRDSLEMVARLMAGDVKVTLSGSSAAFEASGVVLVTRLVEGKFPPHGSIMPKKFTHAIELPREQLLSAIRQASVALDKESCRMEFAFGKNELTLTTQAEGQGDASVVMALESDADMVIAFDPDYIREYLASISAPSVRLELTSPEKPAVLRSEESTGLVMPLAS